MAERTEDLFEGGPVITPEQVAENITELMLRRNVRVVDEVDMIRDSAWVKESILAEGVRLDRIDQKNRFWCTADKKFTDTTYGGNYVINPRPQFTRYADPRAKGMLAGRNDTTVTSVVGNLGMGMYYSEAIDDAHQTVHLRFGLPEFNSLTSFFTGFFDADAARTARTGRLSNTIMYYFGKALTTAGLVVVGLMYWPLVLGAYGISLVDDALKFFMRKPASKFYYLRPQMHLYWAAVSSMVNRIGVYKHLHPWDYGKNDSVYEDILEVGDGKAGSDKKGAMPWRAMNRDVALKLSQMFPIFNEDGFIDVSAGASRAERIAMRVEDDIQNARKSMTLDQFMAHMSDYQNGRKKFEANPPNKVNPNIRSVFDLIESYAGISLGKETTPDGASTGSGLSLERHIRTPTENKITPDSNNKLSAEADSLGAYFSAIQADGAAFATFRVDSTGPVDESFSNSTVESDISTTINSASAQGRAASFSFAGGNVDNGVGTAMLDAVKGFVEGSLDAINASGFLSLAGAAFVDIPQHWENSAANLPKMSYTMQLISPYGNVMSQMTNIYIPLCMLLAGALPISTGKQSYTSPFLVEIYDQGKAQTRLGIIDSLSITRGTSNLGFNKNKQALAVDVSFSVKDLSSLMHMPLQSSLSLNPLKGLLDEDTVFTDYMNVLASAHLGQNLYAASRLMLNFLNGIRGAQILTSRSQWALWVHDLPFVGVLGMFAKDTSRR